MNRALVNRWNAVVGEDDTVYFLGDFGFFGKKKDVISWLEQLNGNIVLIRGNHDNKYVRKAFQPEVYDELPMQIGEFKCMLAHRPFYPDHIPVPGRDEEVQRDRAKRYQEYDFIISGHIHEKRLWTGRSLNVGVDVHNFTPLSEEKVLELLRNWPKDSR